MVSGVVIATTLPVLVEFVGVIEVVLRLGSCAEATWSGKGAAVSCDHASCTVGKYPTHRFTARPLPISAALMPSIPTLRVVHWIWLQLSAVTVRHALNAAIHAHSAIGAGVEATP